MAFVALDERKHVMDIPCLLNSCWTLCDKMQELGVMCRPVRTRDVLFKAHFDVILITRGAAPKHAQSKHV